MIKKRQSSRVRLDANEKVPESWTNEFIDDVRSLGDLDDKSAHLQKELLDKFVSKDTDPPQTRASRAIRKWLAVERENEATNVRLLITPEEYQILPRVQFGSFVEKAREFIQSIIGDVPDFDAFTGGFSGGASTSRRRTESHPASKFLGRADVTEEALPYWESLWETYDGWRQFEDQVRVNLVSGNVMFTVPKNSEIDRVACKEPDLNMFMQRGLGLEIARKLRRVGINLNDQSRNRFLARLGSEQGDLATIDLSSASDSVSYELVSQLMPTIWFASLNALRCKVTLIDGDEHRNEMFSSMGNGFTFELESLLFYALARTTAYFRGVSGVISVYGDDIIVPTRLAQDLTWVLEYFGFSVNSEKSFWTGSFRESCGGHFVNGRDVTPFYLRKPLNTLIDVIHAANSLRKWSEIEGFAINEINVYSIWSKWRDRVPKAFWGGREYSIKTQLVTPHLPRSILRPKKVKGTTGTGGYIHWLCLTDSRSWPGDLQTSEKTDEITLYRPAKAPRTVTWLPSLFIEEIGDAE